MSAKREATEALVQLDYQMSSIELALDNLSDAAAAAGSALSDLHSLVKDLEDPEE